MTLRDITLKEIQEKVAKDQKLSTAQSLDIVFNERSRNYLNELTLFLIHFNTIPNLTSETKIDCKKALVWFTNLYSKEIKDVHFIKRYYSGSKKAELDDVFYILYDDLIVDFDTNNSIVRFLFRKTPTEKIEEIIEGVKLFKEAKKRKKPEIFLLVNTKIGIDTRRLKITTPRFSIEDNYNDDLININNIILKRLSKNNDKGLVILHGKPGTGKTSYIRYLISKVRKNIIFLPPNMAAAITNPELISIMIDNPNSIFVIEDAENIIIDRERNEHSPVSAILNISDGLLSDCLNIQVVCSFNTDISKVDSALLRKGRLIAKYEFKELEVPKANELSKKLGYNAKFQSPKTLTAIYNQADEDFEQVKKINTIGFNLSKTY